MGILDKIKGNPFEKLKKDDLIAERIRLEREEKLRIAAIDKASAQHKALFNKGFEESEAKRRTIIRQMQDLEHKMKLDDIHLKKISDQIRVVNNLIFIQERNEMLAGTGLMNNLLKMPKSKLDKFLARVNLKEVIAEDNLEGILDTIKTEYGLLSETQDDEETRKRLDIWATSDAAEAEEVYKKLVKEQVAREREEELETL